jgi:hypothetical protein
MGDHRFSTEEKHMQFSWNVGCDYRDFLVKQNLNRGMTLRAARVAADAEDSEKQAKMGLREGQAIMLGPNRSLMVAERGEG